MNCACLKHLTSLRVGLPQVTLPPIPPIVMALSETVGGLGPAQSCLSLNANANLSARLSLLASLPPLPIPPMQLALMAALPPMAAHIQSTMRINPLCPLPPHVSARLDMTFSMLNGLALTPLVIGPLLQLGCTLSTIASVKAMLGVNLLAPNAAVHLNAALSAVANLALPINLQALTTASHYALLASVAGSLGVNLAAGIGPLAAALNVAVAVRLPSLGFNPALLTELLAALAALAMIRNTLRIDPFHADFSTRLSASLAPLALLAAVNVPASLTSAAATGMLLAPLIPCLSMNFQAMAAMNFSPLIGIPLPNLGPLSLVASLMAGSRTGACASGCPIAF
jgi:hypothetical protein